jgi:hypothetical protein
VPLWASAKVISMLADVMVMRGVPEHLRPDNGSNMDLAATGTKTLCIDR